MRKHRSFDLAGQALVIVALTALIGVVIEARPFGLTHPIVTAGGLLALGAAAVFIAVALFVRPNPAKITRKPKRPAHCGLESP